MTTILQEIISLLTSGITQLASGIGSGLKALVEAIFLDTTVGENGVTTVNGLSTFGGVVIVFAAISLAIGLSRWVMNFVTSLGASA